MTNYVIDYNTGVRNDFEGTLEEAKDAAEHGMAYTQEHVDILEDGVLVSRARWYGYAPDEDEEDVLMRFGEHGFYVNWDDDY